jgi:uncharacterized protein (DUF4415 family)
MKSRKPLVDEDGEVRELTAEDFKHFRRAEEVIPGITEGTKRLRGQRGSQKAPTKEQITIRLDVEVVEQFRATGKGWQGRINEALKEYVRSHDK